jgi:hypothetical protein
LFEENSKGWHRGLPIRVASSPPAVIVELSCPGFRHFIKRAKKTEKMKPAFWILLQTNVCRIIESFVNLS